MLVLTFQIGGDRMALDTRDVVEVLPRVRLHVPLGSPPWLAGVFVYRGRIVPVVALHRLLNAGECPPLLSSRIILTAYPPGGAGLLGLLAAQVAEVREVPPGGAPPDAGPGPQALGRLLTDGKGLLRLLDVARLLPEGAGGDLAALPQEVPPCP